MNVTVIGAGYVGLNCAAALAYVGHHVRVVEKNTAKLDMLHRGKAPIHEHGLQELIDLPLVRSRMSCTANVAEVAPDAEVILIAVGTPPARTGQADTSFVEEAAAEVAAVLESGRVYSLVVKSTVPVGTNRRVRSIVERVLRQRGVDATVHCLSNPEFLREGMALYDMFYPDRIVIGANGEEAASALRVMYKPFLEQSFEPPVVVERPQNYELARFIVTSPVSAEMIKYAANSFLAMKISFINEIAGLCEKAGADVTEVARGIGLDPRIGPRFLSAGLGWGGSCFPKDTSALLAMGEENGCEMTLVGAARDVNARQRTRVVDRLQEALKGVRGRTVGIMGVAFKPGTDDVRESPVVDVIKLLLDRGADVRVHDPVAMENASVELKGLDVEFSPDPYALASNADAVILATEWPEYRNIDLRRLAECMRVPVFFDARNFFSPSEVTAAGFSSLSVGR